mmetsp:Transcript_115073/g.245836  ORF Transcript_115073/g.245836 Transcript_115073/m.245836 type:complete len:303 (+) Transcript_115073:1057-1965(+)
MLASGDAATQHVYVGVVRRADHQSVDEVAVNQVLITLEDRARGSQPRPQVLDRLSPAPCVGIRNGDDPCHISPEQRDVADVLLAHGSSANDAHAQRSGSVARLLLCGAKDRGPPKCSEHATWGHAGHEGVPGVHHQGVIDQENIALAPLEGYTPLLHEACHRVQGGAVNWGTIPKNHSPLTNIACVIPACEGRDDGVEEGVPAVALVRAQGGQDGGGGSAIAARQPLPSRALLPHGLLGFLSGRHIISFLPRAALSRTHVRHLGHDADIAHAELLHLPGKIWELPLKEAGYLRRGNNGRGAP